eukprot:GGOE01027082.1.p2 GENE.GGOE01027082.1~~GGOE01027082.1.p2  ORF type:complete len:134 (-),score=3.08 GGOE01027082.1:228-629(-)
MAESLDFVQLTAPTVEPPALARGARRPHPPRPPSSLPPALYATPQIQALWVCVSACSDASTLLLVYPRLAHLPRVVCWPALHRHGPLRFHRGQEPVYTSCVTHVHCGPLWNGHQEDASCAAHGDQTGPCEVRS